MAAEPDTQRILEREAASRLLRRLTLGLAALATATGGVVAAVAASTTHARAAVRTVVSARGPQTVPAVPAPTPTVPVAEAGGGAPSGPQSAPSPSSSPPVVVSGGS